MTKRTTVDMVALAPPKFISLAAKLSTQLRTGYVQADFHAENVQIVIPGQVSVMGW